jgi:cytochrome c oxidase subunit 2
MINFLFSFALALAFVALILQFNFFCISTTITGVLNNLEYTKLDAAEPWQIGFQDSASPAMTGIFDLHNDIFYYLTIILLGVSWILGLIIYYFNKNNFPIVHKYWTHGTVIELVWTITPALVLMLIAHPSFALLYVLDEVISPSITIKAVGHQWYWSYEYTDYETASGDPIEFDSYMIPETDLEKGQLRLLDVDNSMKVPVDTHIRIIVQSTDVLHDFAVPSLGVKIDAVPGRLNQVSVNLEREGVFYGQCSEICGTLHGFMPIKVESMNLYDYLVWLNSSLLVPTLIKRNK